MSVFGTPDDLSAQAGGTGTLAAKLRTMTEQLNTLGASGDGAAVPGGAGTDAAKHRLITSQLNQLSLGVPLSGGVALRDPTTGNLAAVTAFHNTDNQSLGGTVYGLMTGGVAQLLNAAGNLDRQRETGIDSIPALGVATGTQQLSSPFATTLAGAATSGSATVFTPVLMSGTNRGAKWSIQVGTVLSLDAGGNQESVVVTTVSGTTFSARSTYNHAQGAVVSGFVYNQARDATAPDGTTGQGFAAGATYLLNNALNGGAGGWEGERSAAGELDGATGAGTAVAAEYEFNSGGPGGGNFDRARNLQGKGRLDLGISAGGATGSVSLTLAAAPSGLLPGSPLTLNGGTVETVYVAATYVQGSNPIGLVSAIQQNGHTSASYDQFTVLGPALSGFLPTGVGIEEECLWDPVTQLYYVERSATQDAMPAANIVAEAPAVWNGATMDRTRGANAAAGTTGIGLLGVGSLVFDGTSWQKPLAVFTGASYMPGVALLNSTGGQYRSASEAVDGGAGGQLPAAALCLFNGNTWDRLRAASTASGTTGTGLLGTGPQGWDKANNVWKPLLVDQAQNLQVAVQNSTLTTQGSPGSLTDRSGTLTASGIAQTVAVSNTARKYLLLQNQSTGTFWFNFGATAQVGQPSLKLDPGASFVMENNFIATQALSIVGLTTGQAYAAKEG